MCWMTVLLAMYLKAGWAGSADVLDSDVEEVFSMRDLRMDC